MIDYLIDKYGPYESMPPHIRRKVDALTAEAAEEWREEQRKYDGMVPAWYADEDK